MLAQLNATPKPSVLSDEAARLKAMEGVSRQSGDDLSSAARTAAMIMAEASASLVAQATYSRQHVSELLTFMPAKPSSETT